MRCASVREKAGGASRRAARGLRQLAAWHRPGRLKRGRATAGAARRAAEFGRAVVACPYGPAYFVVAPVMRMMKRSRNRLYRMANGMLAISAAAISDPQ